MTILSRSSLFAAPPFARSKSNASGSSFGRRALVPNTTSAFSARSKRREENDDFSPSIATSPLREEDDDDEEKEKIETYHLQGVSSGGKSLIVFLSWCAFAEKTGILEPIFVSNFSQRGGKEDFKERAENDAKFAVERSRETRVFEKHSLW